MTNDDTLRANPSSEDQETVAFRPPSELPPGEPLAGTLLKDRYRLIRQLSRGGFGAVHLAQDQQMHDRLVVVKIQVNQTANDPWFDRKFSEEVRALSMIDHPGVVVAIDSGRTADGNPFLVMQFVDGVTLRTALTPEGMPLDRAAAILKQVGDALAAAHERGILHRDLKPENLMLQTSPDGSERVRLIDFGLASVADDNKFQTSTRVSGTVLYMAPEQFEGRISELTDIYAMGLIAYEMLTGRRPFVAENIVQLAQLQRSGVRIKPCDLRPALPVAAERLILKSLEHEPSKRPSNARDFGDRLHDALLGPALRATSSNPENRRGLSRKVIIVGASAAIAAILAGGAYWKLRGHAEPPKTPPLQAEVIAKDARADSAVESEFWESVKQSSDPQFYREYLAKYPQGRFASLAKLKLEILAKRAAPEPTGAAAKPEKPDEDADTDFWEALQKTADPKLYRQYLEAYPTGRFAKAARKKAAQSQEGPASIVPGLPAGLPGMPDLQGVPGVDPRISAELSYWSSIKHAKNAKAYQDYLEKYPNGMFAALARMQISALDNAAKP